MAANVRSGMRVAAVNSNTVDIVVPLSEKGCGIGCDTTQARRADPTQPIDPRIARVVPAMEWTARLTECNDVLYEDRPWVFCKWPCWVGTFFIVLVIFCSSWDQHAPHPLPLPAWVGTFFIVFGLSILVVMGCIAGHESHKTRMKAIAGFDPWQKQYGISTNVYYGSKDSKPHITFTLDPNAHLAQPPATMQAPTTQAVETTGDGIADTVMPVKAPTTFQVAVPAGAIAGSPILVQSPTGAQVQVIVPPNAAPGSVFTVSA